MISNQNDGIQVNSPQPVKQSGAEFLMSIAGMFASNSNDTSENVKSIVSELILKKHGKLGLNVVSSHTIPYPNLSESVFKK